jgi:hypothetical protein
VLLEEFAHAAFGHLLEDPARDGVGLGDGRQQGIRRLEVDGPDLEFTPGTRARLPGFLAGGGGKGQVGEDRRENEGGPKFHIFLTAGRGRSSQKIIEVFGAD